MLRAGLELRCDIEEGLAVWDMPTHLRQVVEILLDNALKYMPPTDTITVWLRHQGARRRFCGAGWLRSAACLAGPGVESLGNQQVAAVTVAILVSPLRAALAKIKRSAPP
ncbi:hypothetical protein [Dysosmobacter sp. Phy]